MVRRSGLPGIAKARALQWICPGYARRRIAGGTPLKRCPRRSEPGRIRSTWTALWGSCDTWKRSSLIRRVSPTAHRARRPLSGGLCAGGPGHRAAVRADALITDVVKVQNPSVSARPQARREAGAPLPRQNRHEEIARDRPGTRRTQVHETTCRTLASTTGAGFELTYAMRREAPLLGRSCARVRGKALVPQLRAAARSTRQRRSCWRRITRR